MNGNEFTQEIINNADDIIETLRSLQYTEKFTSADVYSTPVMSYGNNKGYITKKDQSGHEVYELHAWGESNVVVHISPTKFGRDIMHERPTRKQMDFIAQFWTAIAQ